MSLKRHTIFFTYFLLTLTCLRRCQVVLMGIDPLAATKNMSISERVVSRNWGIGWQIYRL